MATKKLDILLYRADGKSWDGDLADFQIVNLNKFPPKVLKNKKLEPQSNHVQLILDLFFDAGQVYGISVEAAKHRAAYQLINRQTFLRPEGGTKVEVDNNFTKMMLVPKGAQSSNLDEGYALLRDAGSPMAAANGGLSEAAYRALDSPAKKMALLNIEAKLRAARVNGAPLLSFVEGVRYVGVDRLFLYVKSTLKQAIHDSAEFASAPGHGVPKPKDAPPELNLPAHPDSWKHKRFEAGNLQLSFSKVAGPLPGNSAKQVLSVDVDLDLERGLAHVGEWLDNKIHPGKKTDQTLIYTLLFLQGVTPYYALNPLGA